MSVVIDAPKRLTEDIDTYEGPLVFEARTPASTGTSTLLNDLADEDEEIAEGTWVISILSGRRSMSSDQMEDSSNLSPQRASTSPGLLRKRKALILNDVGQAVGDKSTKFSTRIGEIARNEYEFLLAAKDQVLIGANIAWKNKKCELRRVYDKYPIDNAIKRNCPATTMMRKIGNVVVGRAIFPRNQTNNPNEYDVLANLIIDNNAEASGRRGMFIYDIRMGKWFKYPSFILKIIDED
ncbi:hypothetical protein GIB67_033523 [Kingdonia uniflora]|uniref:Uncharacterized protein n=1 Tax=Kingdonia uniflora TaxID=39325 RepID=A0A7J7L6D9_9MAGN|nr:hypothetical protein GIB67_033523 [Kingdonia uniflora]